MKVNVTVNARVLCSRSITTLELALALQGFTGKVDTFNPGATMLVSDFITECVAKFGIVSPDTTFALETTDKVVFDNTKTLQAVGITEDDNVILCVILTIV